MDPSTLLEPSVAGPTLLGIAGLAYEGGNNWAIVATDTMTNASQVVRLDVTDGSCTTISDNQTGTGPTLWPLCGIAVEGTGQLVVVDTDLSTGRVVRIDPTSGDRTIVSDANTGSGPSIGSEPCGIAVEASGQLLVLSNNTLLRIDPDSGDRVLVWSNSSSAGPRAGMASIPGGLVLNPLGQIIVALGAPAFWEIIQIDPVTGNGMLIANNSQGTGPGNFMGVWSITAEADNQIIIAVTEQDEDAGVIRVDPETGNRSIVSDENTGGGFPFLGGYLTGIAFDPVGGQLLATYFFLGGQGAGFVYQIDSNTGYRTLIYPTS